MKKLAIILGLMLLCSNWAAAQEEVAPPNGLNKLEAYSIFYQHYQGENYKDAVKYAAWLWKNMPRTLEGHSGFRLERSLRYIVRSYRALAEQSADPAIKSAYVDTAITIYDKIFEEMGEEEIDHFEWRLEYGRFLHTFSDVVEDALCKSAGQYRIAMEMDRQKLISEGDGYYVQVIIQQMISEDRKDAALQMMEEVEPQVSDQIAQWFDQQREKLFDTPEERLVFLQEKLGEDPDNVNLIMEIRSIHEDLDNTEEVARINQKLYELDPNYENTRRLADAALSDGDNQRALRYLAEAMEKAPDNRVKARIALEISQLHYNADRLQQARQFARQAANLDPESGEPYMRIAGIYARAVSSCTANRDLERDDRAVYWLVLDNYRRAKSVEPSLATRADNQIQRYASFAPQLEDIFFRSDWEEGASLRIDSSLGDCYGWINETTTIPTFEQ